MHRVQSHHFSSPGLTENAASSAGSAPASAPPPQAESGMFALNFLKSSTMAQQKIFIVLCGFLHSWVRHENLFLEAPRCYPELTIIVVEKDIFESVLCKFI